MVKGTLNELSQLKESGFGQPQPRHGLNLLYWFAHKYTYFSNGKFSSTDPPQDKRYGFHKFKNDDDDHIVPVQNLPYYEVGNLSAQGAEELPDYVRKKYSKNIPDSNKDRIIVCQDTNGSFNKVYVTEHLKHDQRRFDSGKTYRVSRGLLQIIKNIESPEQFLEKISNTQEDDACLPQLDNTEQEDVKSTKKRCEEIVPRDNSCSCTIL